MKTTRISRILLNKRIGLHPLCQLPASRSLNPRASRRYHTYQEFIFDDEDVADRRAMIVWVMFRQRGQHTRSHLIVVSFAVSREELRSYVSRTTVLKRRSDTPDSIEGKWGGELSRLPLLTNAHHEWDIGFRTILGFRSGTN